MTSRDRAALFDRWAASYDQAVKRPGFPFDGYDAVLDTIVRRAAIEPAHRILDAGIGTGSLALRMAPLGCDIWGVDISHEMLERARARLPGAQLVHADLLAGWPDGLPERFDRIVSAYVFHEFPDETKLRLIDTLARHLAPGGHIVFGDIAFADTAAHDAARRRWAGAWDHSEEYAVAATLDSALEARRFDVAYEQVSFCGGVFSVRPREMQ